MEEPEQAALSIAGLVNFGNTCFANALLQALASSPAIVQYLDMLFRTLAWSKVVVPYGSGRVGTPLIQALSDALIRLQPHAGFRDLTGTASSLAVLHAMIAHKERVFQQMGVQQDVCEALESILSVLLAEVDSFLQLQRRPLTFSSRMHCRIPRIVDFPLWNPTLDVPIIKNTAKGPASVTPDDMGDLQMRLNKEQGPCNGLLADCLTCSCGHRFSTKCTAFSALMLPIPSFTDCQGDLRVQPGTRLEDCLRLYCEEQGVGPVACPRCSLRATVSSAVNRLQGFNCEKSSSCGEHDVHTRKASWWQRILQWLALKRTSLEESEILISRPCSRSSAGCSFQSRGLAELLDNDLEVPLSGGSQAYNCSQGSSRLSISAWSVAEFGLMGNEAEKPMSFHINPEATKNGSCWRYGLSPSPIPLGQYGSTPTSSYSWGGMLEAYHADSKDMGGRTTPSQCGVTYRLLPAFDPKDFENESRKKPVGKGAVAEADVMSSALGILRHESGLCDSTVKTLREQLEQANIPWQEEKSLAFAKTMVGRLPEVLPIFLHRRIFKEAAFGKVRGGVSFPKILDMSEFVYLPHVKGSIYHLVAVVIHTGDEASGHYLAARRVLVSKTESVWFLASDEHTQQVAEQDVMNLEPCMLLYERENLF